VDVTGRIHADCGPGLYASVIAGLGIAQASVAMCGTELKSGTLVALLTDYKLEPVEVHAVLPGGPRPSAKVRAFTNFLAAEFKTAPFTSVL
jgi:DNA-binding transcriptional LysR family regulator